MKCLVFRKPELHRILYFIGGKSGILYLICWEICYDFLNLYM